MFIRRKGSRWSRLSGGLGVVEEVFAPHRHEIQVQQEARQVIPQERPDSERDRT